MQLSRYTHGPRLSDERARHLRRLAINNIFHTRPIRFKYGRRKKKKRISLRRLSHQADKQNLLVLWIVTSFLPSACREIRREPYQIYSTLSFDTILINLLFSKNVCQWLHFLSKEQVWGRREEMPSKLCLPSCEIDSMKETFYNFTVATSKFETGSGRKESVAVLSTSHAGRFK